MMLEFHDEISRDVELYVEDVHQLNAVAEHVVQDRDEIVDLVHGDGSSSPFFVESSVEAIEPLSKLHSSHADVSNEDI